MPVFPLCDDDCEPVAIRIVHASSGSSAQVNLFGATVTSWTVDGKNRLFVSSKAAFDHSKPIRGGIPVIFPQFNKGKLMPGKHGFARTEVWTHDAAYDTDDAVSGTSATFVLRDNDRTRASGWAPIPGGQDGYRFELRLTVAVKANELKVTMHVVNTDDREFAFTSLLHPYIAAENIDDVKIHGLTGSTFIDTTIPVAAGEESARAQETAPYLSFDREVDSVYYNTASTLTVECLSQDASRSKLTVTKSAGFPDTVTWNPWEKLARNLEDLGDDEYRKFFCLEPGHVQTPVKLQPGKEWDATMTFSV
ncbi:galactose mutarotase-like protein [Ramicandelaber brevisporus]|nr:galactose mutarotase-like protein [Ramicandelaber brevisporus]KAI8873678.1 galactose mutarotase-like protein [Ramicandelaber brevisporus]